MTRTARSADEAGADRRVLRCVTAYNTYGAYCVPSSSAHRPAAKMILAGEVYEPLTIEFIRSHCGDGDLVHAGAYFGDFLPALSRAAAPDATVWSFEPNIENFRCAEITLALNAIQNVALTHAALGERSGVATMATRDASGRSLGGGSMIVETGSGRPGSEAVPVVALDDVVPADRRVTLVHFDLETYEQKALEGSLGTIARSRPILVLESVPSAEWIDANLHPLGYTTRTEKIHTNTVFMPR